MTQQHRFLLALRSLQLWHADAVKARVYNGRTTSGKAEARILVPQRYPHTRLWMDRWIAARTPEERDDVVEQCEAEFARLSRRPEMRRCVDFWRNAKYHPAEETCAICGELQ